MNGLDQLIGKITEVLHKNYIDKATSEYNTEEDWSTIMEICDIIKNSSNGAKECVYLLKKQLHVKIPNVVMQTLTLTDACINNCGQVFKLEVATKDFTKELKNLAIKGHPKLADRAKELIKKWADEFKDDAPLFMIPLLYNELLREGISFPSPKMTKKPMRTNNPDFVETKEEEDDIAKAIHLSLKEASSNNLYGNPVKMENKKSNSSFTTSTGNASNNGLYPTTGTAKCNKKARALYDFEAVEDNEISFKANNIIYVTDDSDQNWWRGYVESNSSSRQGLFPATFVSLELLENDSKGKVVSFAALTPDQPSSEESESLAPSPACTFIDENLMDRCLHMLNVADPTGKISDPEELSVIERKALSTSYLIDQELERVDDCHSELFELNRKLNEALRFYDYLVTTTVMGSGNKQIPPQHGQVPNIPIPNPPTLNTVNQFNTGNYPGCGIQGQVPYNPNIGAVNDVNPYGYNNSSVVNPYNQSNYQPSHVLEGQVNYSSYPPPRYPSQPQDYQYPIQQHTFQGPFNMQSQQLSNPVAQTQHFAAQPHQMGGMIPPQHPNMPAYNQVSQPNTFYPGQNAPFANPQNFGLANINDQGAPGSVNAPQQHQQPSYNYNLDEAFNTQYAPQPVLVPQMAHHTTP